MSAPRHLQLGLAEPQCPAECLQTPAQQLPVAQGHRRHHCPPLPHHVLPGSETSGQQLPAGGGPGLIRECACPQPQGAAGASAAPHHPSRPDKGEAPGCSRKDPLYGWLGNLTRKPLEVGACLSGDPPRSSSPVPAPGALEAHRPQQGQRGGSPSPLDPVWTCRQGLISIGPPVHWPRPVGDELSQPTVVALPGCLGLQAHDVSGFVLAKQEDKAALRPRSKQDRVPCQACRSGKRWQGGDKSASLE